MLTFSRHALTMLGRAVQQSYTLHILSIARAVCFTTISVFVISSFCCFFYCIVLISVCLLRTLGGYKLSAWQPFLELRIQTSKKTSARSSFLACAEEVSRTSEQRSHKYRKPQKVFPRFRDRKEDQKRKKNPTFL